MKRNKLQNYLLFFFASLITIGCITSTITPQEFKFTSTALPSTEIVLMTPIVNTIPLQLIPTLTKEESRIEIENLLTQTSDCKLPCWWGITPGITTGEDVKKFLAHINVSFLEVHETQLTYYSSQFGRPETNYSLDMEVAIDQNLLVNSIIIRSLDNFNLEKFQDIWKNYQPLQILKDYGIPSKIWLSTGGIENNNLIGGMLFLFYDEQGFLVTYQTGAKSHENFYRFCPQIETQIDLYIRSLDSSTFLNFLARDAIDFEYIDTIEEATGKSIEENYNDIMETGCFETHKNIGP